jgi:hypothetical protein
MLLFNNVVSLYFVMMYCNVIDRMRRREKMRANESLPVMYGRTTLPVQHSLKLDDTIIHHTIELTQLYIIYLNIIQLYRCQLQRVFQQVELCSFLPYVFPHLD